ncbi:MAG: PT domain-containing protein [Clostridia bacterium]|nr:PT domain-containing protein [Clostridia bacterium]
MSKNINTFAAGLLALTSIAAASVGCQPQASEQTAANPTEFVEQTETVDATETEAASTFEPTEEPTDEPTQEPTADPTAEPTEEPVFEEYGVKVVKAVDGYTAFIDDTPYPLGDIEIEGLEIERKQCIYICENGKITQVVFPKGKIHIKRVKDVRAFMTRTVVTDGTTIWLFEGGKAFSYEAQKVQLIDTYGAKIDGEEVNISEIPWKEE